MSPPEPENPGRRSTLHKVIVANGVRIILVTIFVLRDRR